MQSFQLEKSSIRGRIVRLGSVLDDVLQAHDYPLPITYLTAETITLSAAIASMLKYEGIFTLQIQGDGPVGMVVSDLTSQGVLRGCSSFNDDKFQEFYNKLEKLETSENPQDYLPQYLGKGYLAFTVDQGEHTDRYQGVVELKGASMVKCVQHYFTQSEQIKTGIKLAVDKRDGKWRGAAIMLQDMPEEESAPSNMASDNGDDWQRVMVLQSSCTDDELLSTDLGADELLFRLFHEEGVRIYDQNPLIKGCRCDETRVENMLMSMGKSDVEHMSVDGNINMKCEFCSKNYDFEKDVILRKIEEY